MRRSSSSSQYRGGGLPSAGRVFLTIDAKHLAVEVIEHLDQINKFLFSLKKLNVYSLVLIQYKKMEISLTFCKNHLSLNKQL
jgi:hypothetical protein